LELIPSLFFDEKRAKFHLVACEFYGKIAFSSRMKAKVLPGLLSENICSSLRRGKNRKNGKVFLTWKA
jgi:hypothetical protein